MGLPVLPDNVKKNACADQSSQPPSLDPPRPALGKCYQKPPKDVQRMEINPAMVVWRTEEDDLCLITVPISPARAKLWWRSSTSPVPPNPGEGGEWDAHGSTGFGPRMAETWHCLMNPAVSYTYKSKQSRCEKSRIKSSLLVYVCPQEPGPAWEMQEG